jgi:HAD superfamily hydrolase (TIGR01662 family)
VITCTLFDLGNTLITDPGPPKAYEIYDQILRAHGIVKPLKDIAEAHDKAADFLDFDMQVELGTRFWIEFNMLFLSALGIEENALDLARQIDSEWWDYADIELFPDVLPVLRDLKKHGYFIGVVSNAFENEIKQIMKKVDLAGFFDVEVGIDTFHSRKPDKQIFLRTLEAIGLPPDAVLFMGDSVELDYEGAENVGMRAVLIDRNRQNHKRGIKSVQTLEDIYVYL